MGTHSMVCQHHPPGVQTRCRLIQKGTWKLTVSFPKPGYSSREGSGGLYDQGRINVYGLGSQKGIVTGTVPSALNSAHRGDHCPAVGSGPGPQGPNPNPTPNQDPPPKPKPASNPNPAIEPPSGVDPHFSHRGRTRDWSRFGPGDVPGLNPKPC